MKRLILSAVLGWLLIGCNAGTPVPPPPPITKRIADKVQRVVSESSTDYNFKPIQVTVTKYYLVADDGMALEVGLSDYVKFKIEDQVSSTEWHVIEKE